MTLEKTTHAYSLVFGTCILHRLIKVEVSSVSFCCSSFFPEQSKKRFARPEECPELPRPTLLTLC